MDGITNYGSLPAENAGRLSKQLLEVGLPKLLLEQGITIEEQQPENTTRITRFARYKALPVSTVAAVEGVTPTAVKLEREEVTCSTDQYIGLIETTDVLQYFHPDFKTSVATQRSGEQAAQTMEAVRFNTFKAGTNKYYANGTARTDVNTVVTQGLLRKAERSLTRQKAQEFTAMVKSTAEFNTEAILPAFEAYGHTDLEYDIRGISGFTDVKDYGHNATALPGEIGSVGRVRFMLSTEFTPYADGGGAKGTMISTTGVSADVYPIMIIGRGAWGGVSFKGMKAIKPFVITPTHNVADPAAQRGYVGWVTFTKNVILNDNWCVILEVACTELT
jgi:N4-gp56 family major capsid protein